MRVHVAFTPSEAAMASLGIVVDVVRATSSIAQALASGYRRVLCCAEVEQARALRASLEDAVAGGERDAIRIEGFDLGASPRELLQPRAETLVLSTTNGTRAILAAAERCDEVVLGSLLNLEAAARTARAADAAVGARAPEGARASLGQSFFSAWCVSPVPTAPNVPALLATCVACAAVATDMRPGEYMASSNAAVVASCPTAKTVVAFPPEN